MFFDKIYSRLDYLLKRMTDFFDNHIVERDKAIKENAVLKENIKALKTDNDRLSRERDMAIKEYAVIKSDKEVLVQEYVSQGVDFEFLRSENEKLASQVAEQQLEIDRLKLAVAEETVDE